MSKTSFCECSQLLLLVVCGKQSVGCFATFLKYPLKYITIGWSEKVQPIIQILRTMRRGEEEDTRKVIIKQKDGPNRLATDRSTLSNTTRGPRQTNGGNSNRHPSQIIKEGNNSGNNLEGKEWLLEQKRRNQYDILLLSQIDEHCFEEGVQVVYAEPSVSEKSINEVRRSGGTFKDSQFPPNQDSLVGRAGKIGEWENLRWKPSDKMMPKANIFEGKPQPKDIVQGYLGDCYFLAGLAALAQRPERIYKLFMEPEKNKNNYYQVKILYRGKWMIVDVDDYFPFLANQPAFGKSKKAALWVMILEKAWAKVYGSYKQIQAGYPQEPLHDLTGAPVRTLVFGNKSFNADKAWKQLLEASAKDYTMIACSKFGPPQQQSRLGIYYSHAYNVISATQVQTKGKVHRIVQLRDPQEKGESHGQWANSNQDRRQFQPFQKDKISQEGDGIFSLEYSTFISEFANISVAQVNDNASYVYESRLDPQSQGVYFTITVSHAGKYSFQVDKTPERSFVGEQQRKHKYAEACLQIYNLKGNKVLKEELQTSSYKHRSLHKWYDLQPGKYVAFARIFFDPKSERDFQVTLAIYSEFACLIKIASSEEAAQVNPLAEWKGANDNKIQNAGRSEKTSHQYPPHYPPKPTHTTVQPIHPTFQPIPASKKDPRTPETKQRQNQQHLQSSDEKGRQTDAGTSRNGSSNWTSEIPSNASTETRRRKIRKIESKITKTETLSSNNNGESFKKTKVGELKRETVTRKKQQGNSIHIQELIKDNEAEEFFINGQSQHSREKTSETCKIRVVLPDGRSKEKIETREDETELVYEDDDDIEDVSLITFREQQKSIAHDSTSSKTSSIRQNPEDKIKSRNLMMRAKDNDHLRMMEPDSEDD